MPAFQKIYKVRRRYNKWVANQTLEDFALRFTARSGRNMSIERVAQTALGATAFLALEGIAAAVTLNYGFTNTVWAMLVVCALFFITGLPITYYSARYGLDIDLLTRGAGFGYLGSTITSLIYASFTFIFFAIEAVILAGALQALLGIPLAVGYFLCAVAVIPIVMHGIKTISRFQLGTQVIWVVLQVTAFAVVIYQDYQQITGWMEFGGIGTSSDTGSEASSDSGLEPQGTGFSWLLFGAAASVFFALVPQIGEQVDYLRFMPPKNDQNKKRWWFWLVLAGPGWVFIGILKMLLGSYLAYLMIQEGLSFEVATNPTYMYQRVFYYLNESEAISLLLAAVMVIVCQMKINVTNAYAGSIAWSNFFSRLTHSHPGRVVWLVFNVTIALLLMELGIYQALEAVLAMFAIVAVSWLGSLAADLLINKPLGLSPKVLEFKRAHLYDINPVGAGAMVLATASGLLCYLGTFGELWSHLSHFVALAVCFVSVPLIAWVTRGRYYIARPAVDLSPYIHRQPVASDQIPELQPAHSPTVTCGVCENVFEREDMTFCPAYDLPICSLCCSLDVRCMDSCRPKARFSRQLMHWLSHIVSRKTARQLNSRLGHFVGLLVFVNLLNAAMLALVYRQIAPQGPAEIAVLEDTLWMLFFTLLIASGVVSWLFLLAHESRVVAQKESNRQTRKLMEEIDAHKATDQALQDAKTQAEQANQAKTRYLSGISHELRTPLQSVLGYAQLLAARHDTPKAHHRGLSIIRRSGQYLTDLIDGLLDISRIEAGKLELFRTRVELPALIDQLDAMFSVEARQKGIGFTTRVQGSLPQWTLTDEKRLRQILINLISNAVKYTQDGSVEFHIRYRNQVAEFSIRDTGPGIDQEGLKRIFNPFERVRDKATANLPGTGLGLTIVRLLTDIMGGDLQVESTPGQGSCFRVSLMLPWVDSQLSGPETLEERLEQQPLLGYEGYQRTIMLVDDDPVLRGLVSELLVPLGFVVLEASDGNQALTLLQKLPDGESPDLFLLDISMPGISGLELAALLRERGIRSPILMISADAAEQDRSPEEQAIYSAYLVKPVSNRRLLAVIGNLLELEWNWRESHTTAVGVPEEGGPVKIYDPKPSDPMPADSMGADATHMDGLQTPARKLTEEASSHSDQLMTPIPADILNHPLMTELKTCLELGYPKGVAKALKQIEHASLLNDDQLNYLTVQANAFQFQQLRQLLQG
jgi:signal transduction histidine kinase/CheY-like chemotaxis protein